MQPNQPGQQGYYQPEPQQPVAAAPPPAAPAAPVAPVTPEVAPVQQPATPAVSAPVYPDPTAVSSEQPPVESQDQFVADELTDEPITWSAFEYIHQEKGKTWFTIFSVITLAFLALAIYLQQWSFAVLIVVIAAVIVVSSKRPPRELTYGLSDEGLSIDGKMHPFEAFKAFGVIHDGLEYSIMLIPTQRFQPGVTVYFPEEAGEDIVDLLGSVLPMKDLKLDAVDRVVRLLRL